MDATTGDERDYNWGEERGIHSASALEIPLRGRDHEPSASEG